MKERVKAVYEFLRKPEHLTARNVTSAKLSRVANAALAIGKIGLGVYSLSLFLCVNGFYNVGIAAAKHFAVRVQEDEAAQLLTYKRVGGWLTFTSALYIVYAANMAARGRGNVQYDTITGIAIATFTFTEIGMAVYGVLKARRVKNLAVEAMKRINLVSSLVSLVLTQAALISLEGEVPNAAKYCGYTGLIFGAVGLVIGVTMIFRKNGGIDNG